MNSISYKIIAFTFWLVSETISAQGSKTKPYFQILNQIEKYSSSTAQIVFDDSFTCSGVLINNTRDEGKPLLLTAAHCLQNKEELNSIVVILGKRKLILDQPYEGLQWTSNTGASLLASSNKIDFALLELNSKIPDAITPTYLGWSKEISQPTLIYSIHHPDFDYLQYSFSLARASLATFAGLYNRVDFGHWKVDRWTYGITSPGSSGAPLLDSSFKIIGGLSGSTDWDNYKSDYFFRFDLAYDHFSNPANQLQPWIDPDNSGSIGHYQPTRKIRNYDFTSAVTETINIADGDIITEEFAVADESNLNGVYITIGEVSDNSDSILAIVISQGGAQLATREINSRELSRYSENYIDFNTQLLVEGKLSISLSFRSDDHSHYISLPMTNIANFNSYFLALNSSKP